MKITYKEKEFEIEESVTIQDLLKEEIENSDNLIIGAKFNNEYSNLAYEIKEDGKIELIDISTKEGMKIYRRTLIYLLGKACKFNVLRYR
jgi:uridine kinase